MALGDRGREYAPSQSSHRENAMIASLDRALTILSLLTTPPTSLEGQERQQVGQGDAPA